VTRKGVTTIEAEGNHPAFDCTFVIKYKAASGWVDWKKSQLKCKPSTATTQAPGGSSSCQGKCGASYSPSLACQCNSMCPQYGNCCQDYAALCTGGTSSPPTGPGCTLARPDQEGSRPEWPPLMLDSRGGLIVANETDGERRVSIGVGESAHLYCPKKEFEHYPASEELELRCGEDGVLSLVTGSSSSPAEEFARMGCDKQYREDFVEPGRTCGPPGMQGELVQVGFTANDTFHWMFTSCHQASRAHNLWVHHVVAAAIPARDQNNDRPSFSKDGYYSGYDINGMYTKNSQEEVVGGLVGSATLTATYFPGGDVYIARGHLAPNADFLTYAWQDATFTFIDVAPQWQSFNAGNWLDIENGVRYLAEQVGALQVWTGTHGVLQLADASGALVDIYLDDEGLEKVPVPGWFWKVVVHEGSRRGLALLGANNPHAAQEPPCSPVLGVEEVTWLSFVDTSDITSGPLTVCTVEALQEAVEEFPGGVDTSGGLLLTGGL